MQRFVRFFLIIIKNVIDMRFFFPLHLDAGNRGCEGIARGSAILLNTDVDNIYGLCTNIRLDKKLNIDGAIVLCALEPFGLNSRDDN